MLYLPYKLSDYLIFNTLFYSLQKYIFQNGNESCKSYFYFKAAKNKNLYAVIRRLIQNPVEYLR